MSVLFTWSLPFVYNEERGTPCKTLTQMTNKPTCVLGRMHQICTWKKRHKNLSKYVLLSLNESCNSIWDSFMYKSNVFCYSFPLFPYWFRKTKENNLTMWNKGFLSFLLYTVNEILGGPHGWSTPTASAITLIQSSAYTLQLYSSKNITEEKYCKWKLSI